MAQSVEQAFEVLLERQLLTPGQAETAKTRVAGLANFFVDTFSMAEQPFPMGSYARDTICRSERDIDLMAPFSVPEYWERYKRDSRAFLYWVRDWLNDRYFATKVSSKQVAVTLDFTVIVADVAPCFRRTGGGYLMPNGRGGWMATNPLFHTRLIGEADTARGRRLRPLIRLIKFWNIANGHHLRSFHVELMVKRMWDDRSIPEWPTAVAKTLGVMGGWVRSQMDDPWPDRTRVDAYLSANLRSQVIRMLGDDAKAAATAEEYRQAGKVEAAFERWGVIYRHQFPAYG